MELILTLSTQRSHKKLGQMLNQAADKIPLEISRGKTKGEINFKLAKFKAEWELTSTAPPPNP